MFMGEAKWYILAMIGLAMAFIGLIGLAIAFYAQSLLVWNVALGWLSISLVIVLIGLYKIRHQLK
jgi:hypothetical protein